MIIYAWSHPPKVSELELQQKTCLLTVGASLQTKVNFFLVQYTIMQHCLAIIKMSSYNKLKFLKRFPSLLNIFIIFKLIQQFIHHEHFANYMLYFINVQK